MKRISFLVLIISILHINLFSQNSARFAKKNYTIEKDFIEVNNKPGFFRFKYSGDQYKEQDAIKFTLEVKNNSKHLIPGIQTARWQSKIHIYINGQNAMQLSLANFMFGGNETIAKDSSDTWDFDLQITGPDAVDFGQVFTWQWEYMEIKSSIIQVDLTNKTFMEVGEHIKSDKKIY